MKVIEDAETGERFFKGNPYTEIVLDMVNTSDNYDPAILLSGDSDLECAVELLRSCGRRVYGATSRGYMSPRVGLRGRQAGVLDRAVPIRSSSGRSARVCTCESRRSRETQRV